jgi:uncharacterized protein YjbI with pentapeptide repeats
MTTIEAIKPDFIKNDKDGEGAVFNFTKANLKGATFNFDGLDLKGSHFNFLGFDMKHSRTAHVKHENYKGGKDE